LRSAPLLRQQVVEGLEMKIPELQGIEALKKNVVGVADLAVIRELVKLILGTRRAFFSLLRVFFFSLGQFYL
jgi:hypothetical protein